MGPILDILEYLQKIPLRVIGLGPDSRIFTCQKENDFFIAENSSRKTFFNLLFFGTQSIFIFSGLFYLLLGMEVNLGLIVVGFIIHPIIGVFGLRKFLWLIKGMETVKVDSETLTVVKTGTFWTKKKVYQISKINNVKSKYETKWFLSQPKIIAKISLEIKESQRSIYCFTIGEIECEYEGSRVRLFSDMKERERQMVIENIKEFVEKPCQ